jgi:hypothetical protein
VSGFSGGAATGSGARRRRRAGPGTIEEPSLHHVVDLTFARARTLAAQTLPHLGLGELEEREGHAEAFRGRAAIGRHDDILQEGGAGPQRSEAYEATIFAG